MRAKPLKTPDLILSPSKDEAKISCFFSSLLDRLNCMAIGRFPVASPFDGADEIGVKASARAAHPADATCGNACHERVG
jgi:hypothetical protein